MLSDEEVIGAVRLALRRIHDTPALRTNPLIGALGLTDAPNAVSELRRILTEAIHSLRPDVDVPADSRVWRVHDILEFRFLQQAGQGEVAKQLGLSIRHLRREEVRAAEVLAQALSTRLDRTVKAPPVSSSPLSVESADVAEAVRDELAWLDDDESAQEVDLGDVLAGAVSTARALAEARGLDVELCLPETALHVTIHSVALREMILELLTAALCHSAEGGVTVGGRARDDAAVVEIRASRSGQPPTVSAACDAAVAMARHLASRCGVVIGVRVDEAAFCAEIVLPLPRHVPVLVIDDNEDTVRLWQRYAAGTQYHVLSASSLAQALEIAARIVPCVIVLDVMMPHVDGWQVLAQLRHHPLTASAPVVVCSILTQEELALSLGASDYVRKPVTRDAFLRALERHLPPPQPRHPGAQAPPSAPLYNGTSLAG